MSSEPTSPPARADSTGTVTVPASLGPESGSDQRRMPAHAGLIAFLGVFQAAILLAGLVRWKVIALLLGPQGVGIASVIDQIAQIALRLGSLSLPIVALKFLALARSRQPADFWGLYRVLLRLMLTATAGVAALAMVLVMVKPGLVGKELAVYALPLVLGLASVPWLGGTALLKSVLATLDRYRTAALVTFLGSVTQVAAVYIGIRLGGLTGLYVGMLIAGLGLFAVLRHLVIRGGRTGAGGGRTLAAFARTNPEIVRFAASLYAVALSTALMYGAVRYTVLVRLGAAAAGYLAAAYAIALAVRLVLNEAAVQYLIPSVSRPIPKETRSEEVATYVRALAVLLLAICVPVMLFPYEVLVILYSPRFVEAVSFLALFLLAEAVLVIADVHRVLLIGFDDRKGYVSSIVPGQLVVIACALAFVPRYGIVGAGVGHIIGAVLVLAMSVGRLRRRHGVPWYPRSALVSGYSLMATAVVGMVGHLAPTPGWVTWGWKMAVAILVCASALPLLTSADRRSLLSLVRVTRPELESADSGPTLGEGPSLPGV